MTTELIIRIVVFIVGVGAGLFIGATIGYSMFESLGIKELRRRIEDESDEVIAPTPLNDTRSEHRQVQTKLFLQIRIPVVDDAGMLTAGQTQDFYAQATDLSRKGGAILSQVFVPIGLVVEIFCRQKYLDFMRKAVIRDTTLQERGIRIGFEFTEPLQEKTEDLRFD